MVILSEPKPMVTPFGSMVEEPGIAVTDIPLIIKIVGLGDTAPTGMFLIVVRSVW